MNSSHEKIVEILIKRGNELLKQPYKKIEFTKNPEANNLLTVTLLFNPYSSLLHQKLACL